MATGRLANSNFIANICLSYDCMDWTKINEKVNNVCSKFKNKINKIYFNFLFIIDFVSRKPFSMKNLLIPYNLALAMLNFYIAYELLNASRSLNYNYICEPCRQVYSADELRVSFSCFSFSQKQIFFQSFNDLLIIDCFVFIDNECGLVVLFFKMS